MLRRIIGLPEAVYYRGRFRASVAWTKVGHEPGRGDWTAPDEAAQQNAREGDRPLRERLLPGRLGLRATPAGSP